MRHKKGALISGFDIDAKGKILATLNLVSYMKVGSKGLGPKNFNKKSLSDDEDDEEEVVPDKLLRDEMINSDEWVVARTIYSTLTIQGRVAVDKIDDENSELVMQVQSFSVSKLDFHKGHPDDLLDKSTVKRVEDEEEDFDEDDDSNDSDDKTSEGGIIQALLNMQLKPLVKQFLPNLKLRFSNEMKRADVFNCYGMHLRIPVLQYFKGGFNLQGNFDRIPIKDETCIGI